MKLQIRWLLYFENDSLKLRQRPISKVSEARQIVQAEFDRLRLDYIFGQIVYSDDSRKDIFPNKRKHK